MLQHAGYTLAHRWHLFHLACVCIPSCKGVSYQLLCVQLLTVSCCKQSDMTTKGVVWHVQALTTYLTKLRVKMSHQEKENGGKAEDILVGICKLPHNAYKHANVPPCLQL